MKPFLASLALPPVSLLLMALLGLALAWCNHPKSGLALASLSVLLLALLSCHGSAVWLARNALPQFNPIDAAGLKAQRVQTIVILGGDVLPLAPEYGDSQPGPATAARLRYGVWLARQSGLPLAFTGGLGWSAHSTQKASEADVAARMAREDYGMALRWNEGASRDTRGNARLLAPLLQRDGVQRIALVTHAWHMPRAVAAFEQAGLAVTPAPMGYVLPVQHDLLEWLPSAHGLQASRQVLCEWLALTMGRFLPA